MTNITSIELLDNTLANLKLLALKLDKDVISTIEYIYYSCGTDIKQLASDISDYELNTFISELIDELNAEEYELNRHDVELGDNGKW